MKTKHLLLGASLFLFLGTTNAQIGGKIGSIKDKAKEKVSGSGNSKTNSDATGTSENNSSTSKSGLSCDDLVGKADGLYASENYSEAWKYYSEAEDQGCVSSMDGMSRMNMNDCKKIVNTTPEEEAEQLEQINSLMAQMEDMKYKCENIPTDNGSSGSFHDSNVGKIVFSKSEIVKGQENPGSIVNSFTSSDNIYSRVYMAHSIGYECANMGICYGDPYHSTIYRYTVDGGKYSFSKSYFDDGTMTFNGVSEDQMNKWTTWQPALSPSSKDGYGTSELQFFYSMIEFLPAGNHTVKLEIVIDIPEDQQPAGSRTEENCRKYTTKFGEEKVLAVGEFTLEVKEADKSKIKSKTGALSKAELDKKNQDTFNSTMENSGVWLINKCSSPVKVIAGGNSVTVNGNGSTRISLKAGQSIESTSGSVIRYFSSDPPAGQRTDVIVCN